MAARILLVEDETHVARGVRENLEAEGYAVEVAIDGVQGLARIRRQEYSLVILDVMLPGLDGFTVCRQMRTEGIDTPVLFLSARAGGQDRIAGLGAGGDDYLAKPFDLRELLLRVAAIVRRRARFDEMTAREPVLRFGGNELDFRTCRGHSADGTEQVLSQKEAMILKALADRPGEVLWREDILEKVWGNEVLPSSRIIDQYVDQLRQRFEADPATPRFIQGVRGAGYRFTDSSEFPT